MSVLIADLAFATAPGQVNDVESAILVASVLSAVIASVILGLRNRGYRRAAHSTE